MKYNNKRVEYNGITFDSKLEMEYYRDVLLPLKDKGIVTDISIHPGFSLAPSFEKYGKKHNAIYYVADFMVEYEDGRSIVIDVKGMATETALIKRKLFDGMYTNMTLNWVSYSIKHGNGWMAYDDLQTALAKQRKERKKCASINGQQQQEHKEQKDA